MNSITSHKIFILIFLIMFCANGSSANERSDDPQSCPEIDYGPQLGPSRMQLDSQWCWAYAGADALSFALGLSSQNRVSPIDFAIQTLTADTDHLSTQLGESIIMYGKNISYISGIHKMVNDRRNNLYQPINEVRNDNITRAAA